MKKNYLPWRIKTDDFFRLKSDLQRLNFLIGFGVLAPSSHNTQPWLFKVSDSRIQIFLEKGRGLPVGDVNNRQANISLGCAVENILIAADYYGYETKLNFVGRGDLIAEIELRSRNVTDTRDPDHLIFSIPKRVTNRNKYKNNPLPHSVVQLIKSLETDDLRIDIVSEKILKDKIADISLNAGVAAMEDPEFRKELSHHVKNNLTFSPTGIPASGMGIPTPISFLAPFLVKHFNMNRLTYKKDEEKFKQFTPAFVIISTKNDNIEAWFEVGMVYEKIALISCQKNIFTSPWAASIQIGNFYQELIDSLNINERPQMFCRIGYAKKSPPASPRIKPINTSLE